MQNSKFILFLSALLFAFSTAAIAGDAAKVNETLLKATSPFEDMVKYALDRKEAKLAKALASANSQAPAIREALPAPASAQFDKLFATLQKAAASGNNYAVAKSAVQTFRLLIENLLPEELKVPVEVSWLDYAGFNLHVLASSPRPDWGAIRQTVEDAGKWWEASKAKVTDKSLRYTMDSAVQGLQTAGKSENLPMLYFAAQMDLDIVDLLENHFEGKK
jgi:hypothetical protein